MQESSAGHSRPAKYASPALREITGVHIARTRRQFHPSDSYEDFVGGLKPKLRDGSIEYAVEKGILRDLADEAAHPYYSL